MLKTVCECVIVFDSMHIHLVYGAKYVSVVHTNKLFIAQIQGLSGCTIHVRPFTCMYMYVYVHTYIHMYMYMSMYM